MRYPLSLLAVALAAGSSRVLATDSQCFGSVSQGRIEHSVALPSEGANFTAYSKLAVMLGRTQVHTKVAEIISASYAALQHSSPANLYVYGETGWPSGGPFWPHRTSPVKVIELC